jgi:hypothetical protein
MQVLKKGLSGRQGLPHQLVRLIHPPQHRMEQTCEEIQRESHGRQVLLAMAIVMFEMRAFGCKGVVVLVLDVPAGASGLHDRFLGRVIEMMVRRKRIVIQDGPVGLFGDGEFTPIDPQCVFSLAQGDIVGIPIGVDGAKATIPAADGERQEIPRDVYPGQPLVQRWVRLRLADQMESIRLSHAKDPVLQALPDLTADDVEAALVSSAGHPEEIDGYIQEQTAAEQDLADVPRAAPLRPSIFRCDSRATARVAGLRAGRVRRPGRPGW